MSGDTGEKTEEASPEKLRKAKEQGQVPKSQDFVGALGFCTGFFVLMALLDSMADTVKHFTLTCFENGLKLRSIEALNTLWIDSLETILKAALPVLAAVFVMAVFSNVVQTGFFLAFKAITPKIDKLNPMNGLKQMFKVKKFVELLKNVVKMATAAWLAWAIMEDAVYDMTLAVTIPLHQSVQYGGGLLWDYLVRTAVLFIVIGCFDLIYSRKAFAKEQKMSKYDVKQEYKQSEGDPQMKGQRKQLAQELLFSGNMENVKNADAVIVNPTHIAVAIKYDKDKGKAPVVVAKGMRIHAEKIKEIAKQHGVPVLRNVSLAQALHKLDVDEEVPEDLYEAVAEVLAFVMKLKEEQEDKGRTRAQKGASEQNEKGPERKKSAQSTAGPRGNLLKRGK